MRPQSPVGKTHDKLGAALARFSIPGAIRGQRILDVNGSTPGFAAVLLELGAAQVTSVSVGPTPLSPALRKDARVSFVERVELKTMPAADAPGPFAFFSVDLRFASARSALRAVAFRIAPATHGIAWVRPMFEAALEHKNQSLTGKALRDRALDHFMQKATRLGFEIVAEADGRDDNDEHDAQVAVHLLSAR
jgi:23S rRNA (cytidine1920-2'-O)/16S rRNA (cytidine1409-2'-O)-methyltransferase